MLLVGVACLLLIALTTLIHYEMLRAINARLPALSVRHRARVVVVFFGAFVAHAVEIVVYGGVVYLLLAYGNVGTLTAPDGLSLLTCVYFSAETYTSLGFGDITPVGPIRLLAGVEALNGLLLIGWSASYLYLVMERFWDEGGAGERRR